MGVVTGTVVAGDEYTRGSELKSIAYDRLDVLVRLGDARMQFFDGREWWPIDGIPLHHGLFYSKPGLTLVYPPRGPLGVRFKRDVAGVASELDVELYSIE